MRRCEFCKAYLIEDTEHAHIKDSSWGEHVCGKCDTHMETIYEMFHEENDNEN